MGEVVVALFAARQLRYEETARRIRHHRRLLSSASIVGDEICSCWFRSGDNFLPSADYLANVLHMSPRTVKKALQALQATGYIEAVKTARKRGFKPIFAATDLQRPV
jgi:DNA-binding GntR family transcriptional regulator